MSKLCRSTYIVAAYFKAHPNQWVSAMTLAEIGGALSSRTRISEARRCLGMDIQNRTRTVTRTDGRRVKLSEFRYVPATLFELAG